MKRHVLLTVSLLVMQRDKLSARVAVDKLLSVRPIVCPNVGFMRQLEIYEESGYDVELHPDGHLKWKVKRDENVRQAAEIFFDV